jgi:hypothetical protein
VSASLGACEDTPAEDVLLGASQRADQALLIQAAMEGRTLFASAGDTGTGCPPLAALAVNGVDYVPYPGQEYPSIDPNATAVGGTVLYTTTTGTRAFERAWDHTGGGPSKFLPQMPWQNGASPELQTNACPGVYGNGTPFPGGGNLCRAGNDVAAESGDITISLDHKIGDGYAPGGYDPRSTSPVQANGFDMVDFCPASEVVSENPAQASCSYAASGGTAVTKTTDGTTEQGDMTDHFSEGGTSLSSPLWLGMWALVQAHHDAGNAPAGSLGLATPLIYGLAQGTTKAAGSGSTRDFNDISVGGNPLPAHPGWDFPTGWGTPNVKYLAEDASGNASTLPASNVLPSGGDPTPIVAQVPTGPACGYALYDPSSDATDLNQSQDDQLDLVQGTLGLTPDRSALRVVMNLKNLSKSIPTGSNYLDYEFFWTNRRATPGRTRWTSRWTARATSPIRTARRASRPQTARATISSTQARRARRPVRSGPGRTARSRSTYRCRSSA